MNEYDVKTPYGTYQTKGGEDPYSILMKMASWNKEIRSTISEVTYDLDATIEKQSQILQDVSSITLNVTEIDSRVGAAEGSITVLAGEVALKATQVTVDGVNNRLVAAEGSIVTQAGLLALKATTAVVDGIGSRVSTAEVNINSLTGNISSMVSYTDYNGVKIASLINQSASNITIAAQAIDLVGITRVASSIELGNTGSGGTKAIKFNGSSAWIYSTESTLNIDSSWLDITGRTTFRSEVDFSLATIKGLNLTAKFG